MIKLNLQEDDVTLREVFSDNNKYDKVYGKNFAVNMYVIKALELIHNDNPYSLEGTYLFEDLQGQRLSQVDIAAYFLIENSWADLFFKMYHFST